MKGAYPFKIRSKYPGLTPEDKQVWERFILSNPKIFHSVDYNVRVGRGVQPPSEWGNNYKKMVIESTQLRIDAVGYSDSDIYVIELKPTATIKAVGQLIGYSDLFVEHFNPPKKPLKYCICNICPPDIAELFWKHECYFIALDN